MNKRKVFIFLLTLLFGLFILSSCDGLNINSPTHDDIKYGRVSIIDESTDPNGGSITLSQTGKVEVDTVIEIIISVNDEYNLSYIKLNDEIITGNSFKVIEGTNKVTYKIEKVEIPVVDSEKHITITADNFEKLKYMNYQNVSPNISYPNEFTVNKGIGSISSVNIPKISQIMITVYGNYENLVIYDDIEDGREVTYSSVTDSSEYNKGREYIYNFQDANSFLIANPSSYDVYIFEINITYFGVIDEYLAFVEEEDLMNITSKTFDKYHRIESYNVTIQDESLSINKDGYLEVTGLVNLLSIKINSTDLSNIYLIDSEGNQINYNINSGETYLFDNEFAGFMIINESDNSILISDIYVTFDDTLPISAINATIKEAVSLALSLNRNKGTSGDLYRITGVVSNINGSQVTVSSGDDYIVAYSATSVENMNLGYTVTIVGLLQNYYGKAEIINYEVENYSSVLYQIVLGQSENGQYIVDKDKDFSYGEYITITAYPDEGYIAKYAYVDDRVYRFNDNICKASIISDSVISVVFAIEEEINPIIGDEYFTIHSLEMVGTYGDANLIQYGNFDCLVDGGTASDAVNLRNMLSEYVTDGVLDLIIISHPDSDHYAGITNGALSGVNEVKRLITNNSHADNDKIKSAVKAKSKDVIMESALGLTSVNNKIYTIEVDEAFSIDIMYNSGYEASSKNNASIPAIFNYKNTKLFMGGDMEESACTNFISMYPDLFQEDDFVMFKVLHHGSNGSNKTNFLTYLKPDFAFVNAPLKVSDANQTPNFSTHPYLDAMIRVGALTTNTYWAGLNGNLTIICDGYTAIVTGDIRTRDYKYYDSTTKTYVLASRVDEANVSFFESAWYKEAIINKNAPDYAGIMN